MDYANYQCGVRKWYCVMLLKNVIYIEETYHLLYSVFRTNISVSISPSLLTSCRIDTKSTLVKILIEDAAWYNNNAISLVADEINVDKCAVMHIGHNNSNGNYTMTNQQLPVTEEQRDLGIIITKDLKWQQQTEKSCKTANKVLTFIASNFKYKNREMVLPLYKSLVRPHLEYAAQFWSHIYNET